MPSINRRMDRFVPRDDGAGVLTLRPALRSGSVNAPLRHCTPSVIARRAAPWQSMPSQLGRLPLGLRCYSHSRALSLLRQL
jgi:hypothetical protein